MSTTSEPYLLPVINNLGLDVEEGENGHVSKISSSILVSLSTIYSVMKRLHVLDLTQHNSVKFIACCQSLNHTNIFNTITLKYYVYRKRFLLVRLQSRHC